MVQYLVLDIGGTFIKYAIMDGSAQFIQQGKVPAETSCEKAMLSSLGTLKDAVADCDYEGVAISMPGRIDTAHGWARALAAASCWTARCGWDARAVPESCRSS